MTCKNCNSEINEARFCPYCGTDNAPVQSAQQAQPTQDVPANGFGTPTNGYPNPPVYQQNPYQQQQYGGYNAAPANYGQYTPNNQYGNPSAPVAQPAFQDPGESKATAAMIWGIVSLFFGIIPAIIALVMSSKYNQMGNGSCASKAKAGKIMAIISIVLCAISLVISILSVVALVSAGSALVDTLAIPMLFM